LPADTIEGLQRWFTFRDFNHFIQIYATGSRCLKHSEDYELIVYEFAEEMAQQHVRYAEATFSASTHQFLRNIPFDVYFSGLTRGRERARQDFQHHPLPVLLTAGIPVTINSDDPPLFNTTLNNEIGLLHSAFHLDVNTINDILLNGVRFSFLPAERKAKLVARFERELRELQMRYHVEIDQED
jgi:adenosine deaminase